MFSRRLPLSALIAYLGLWSLASPAAQPPQFRSRTNLVLVDVRIEDSQGRPVTGLSAEDFGLFEEGVPQKIDYFREISLPLNQSPIPAGGPGPAPPAGTQTSPAAPAPGGEESLDKRLLLLLFHFEGAGPQEVQSMKQAAARFLETELTPQDAAAVLVFDGSLEMLSDLTSDHRQLSAALTRLSSPQVELETSLPEEDTQSSDDSLYLADDTEFALFETDRQLSVIQTIADAFRDVVGRKALVYFSSGLTQRGIENDDQMRLTTDLCNRSNISIYPVDARGLVALSPGGGAHRGAARGSGIFTGGSSLGQLRSLASSQDSLVTLAETTGGQALLDDNDLFKIFRTAQEDSSHYYLLGYHTPPAPRDGRFRNLKVTARVSYQRLDHRPGYHADKPYLSLTSQERESELMQAVLENRSYAELPVEISAEYLPSPLESYQVPVLLAFDHRRLSALSGHSRLNLEVVILGRNPEGRAVAGVRDSIEIRSDEEKEEDTRFIYQNLLTLDPGRYEITAYLRDNRTGLMSSAAHNLEIPEQDLLHFGSLVLAGAWREGSASGFQIRRGGEVTLLKNPLEIAGRLLVPRVNATFQSRETMLVHTLLLRRRPVTGGRFRILFNDAQGETIYEGEWRPLTGLDSGSAAINLRLPLAQFAPGSYRLLLDIEVPDHPPRRLTRPFKITD